MTAKITYLVPPGVMLESELWQQFGRSGVELATYARWLRLPFVRQRFAQTYSYRTDQVVGLDRALYATDSVLSEYFLRKLEVAEAAERTGLCTALVEHFYKRYATQQIGRGRSVVDILHPQSLPAPRLHTVRGMGRRVVEPVS
jgi:hypothetical protein